MFTIYLTNFGYFKEQEFSSFEEAAKYGVSLGFCFGVYKDGKLVRSYDTIGGWR